MFKRLLSILVFLIFFNLAFAFDWKKYVVIDLGRFSEEKINQILKEANSLENREKKMEYLSEQFLGVPYKRIKIDRISENDDREYLVVDLSTVDCMTYIEYLEALSRSKDFDDFVDNLRKVRYKFGIVRYSTRNHYFTDWIDFNGYKDIGKEIAPDKAITVKKHLNFSREKGVMLKGAWIQTREFSYIPSEKFDREVISKLKTGDMVGAYAYGDKYDWLDVTHVGIIVKKGDKTYFRNASSLKRYNKVVDIPLEKYLKRVKGLVILRKKE